MPSKSRPVFDVAAIVTGILEHRINSADLNHLTRTQRRKVGLALAAHYFSEHGQLKTLIEEAFGHRPINTFEAYSRMARQSPTSEAGSTNRNPTSGNFFDDIWDLTCFANDRKS